LEEINQIENYKKDTNFNVKLNEENKSDILNLTKNIKYTDQIEKRASNKIKIDSHINSEPDFTN